MNNKSIFELLNPLKFKYYFHKYIPSIIFWGVKLDELDETKCTTTVPFKRKTQNPFKSIYFSALAGTAELSTGLLLMAKLEQQKESFSMLVIKFEMEFHKKADDTVYFSCNQGQELDQILEQMDEKAIIPLKTYGKIGDTIVAEATIHWTIKKRQSK